MHTKYVLFLCAVLISPILTGPVAEAHAEPLTGMEMYMGTLMAATLLAKGYLFGALIHGGLADVRKSRHQVYGYGRYYGGYNRVHSHLAALREIKD